jgi:hypothetical protein
MCLKSIGALTSSTNKTTNIKIMYTAQPQQDYLDAALVSVLQIHRERPAVRFYSFYFIRRLLLTLFSVTLQRVTSLCFLQARMKFCLCKSCSPTA